jgi:phage terminase large subunit-like protein
MAGRPRSVLYKPTAESILAEIARRQACPYYTYFPETGPLRRELYPKHMAFFAAGATWRQRALISGNRTGKSQSAAYELVCHMTGEYPAWWRGRRFDKPVECWGAGDTGQTTRNIIQVALLGPTSVIDNRQWAGMIPAAMVYDISRKAGIPDAVSTIWVRHKSGGISTVDLLSYDQKREAFQGTARSVVWLDEECPPDVYGECLMRTMTTDGTVMVTFTPLQGLTPFIADWLSKSVLEVIDPATGLSQLAPARQEVFGGDLGDNPAVEKVPGEQDGLTRYTVMATWDDCPHLSPEAKAAMLAEYPPYQRDARSRGIPALGSGVIYPVPESEIKVQPFAVPDHWPRVFGLDLDAGAGWTAAVWVALDRETGVYYVYDVYKRGHAEPSVHAAALKSRGDWIPGVGDAAGLMVTMTDSRQYLEIYRQLGVDLVLPDKAVEAGIQHTYELLSSGRLKFFASCGPLFDEYRMYRRDDKGRVVKQHDHCCDSLRYAIHSGLSRMKTRPGTGKQAVKDRFNGPADRSLSWLQ